MIGVDQYRYGTDTGQFLLEISVMVSVVGAARFCGSGSSLFIFGGAGSSSGMVKISRVRIAHYSVVPYFRIKSAFFKTYRYRYFFYKICEGNPFQS